jgi:hypothetical protein
LLRKTVKLEPVKAEPVGAFSGADPRTIEFYLELALRT